MSAFNQSLFQFLYSFAHHSKITDYLFVFCASYIPYIIVLLLVYIYFKKNHTPKDRKMIALAFVAGVIARFILKGIIVYLYPHPRPYIVLSNIHPLISQIPSESYQSFPSGHAIFFFAVATVVYFYHKKLGKLLFVGSLLMVISRIIVGVHFPYDIVGGIVLGIIVGYGTMHFYERFKKNLDPILTRVCEWL